MTLIEAIKSRRSFKRKGWCHRSWLIWVEETWIPEISIGDIIADDWEIQEKPVSITRSQLKEAFEKANGFYGLESIATRRGPFEVMADHLGL